MFEPGQRVRCVDANFVRSDGSPSCGAPVLGGIYTVVNLWLVPCPLVGEILMIDIAERPPVAGLGQRFDADAFAPISDSPAEIERLRAECLEPPPLKVRELAGLLP